MVTVTCDGCGEPIKGGTFILKLTCSITQAVGLVKAVRLTSPIDSEKLFCGLDCLKDWANQQ